MPNKLEIPTSLLQDMNSALIYHTHGPGPTIKNELQLTTELVFAYGNIGRMFGDGRLEEWRLKNIGRGIRARRGLIDVGQDEYLKEFNIVTPSLKNVFDSLLTSLLINSPSFKVRSLVPSNKNYLLSRGLNALVQYLLNAGKYYDNHRRELMTNVALIGTGYTRVGLVTKPSVDEMGEDIVMGVDDFDITFDYIPPTRVIDDGSSTSGDLKDSRFVIVLHSYTRATAKEFFMMKMTGDATATEIKETQEYLDSTLISTAIPKYAFLGNLDLDIDNILNYYADRSLDKIYVAEVFWKSTDKANKVKNYTSWMLFNSGIGVDPVVLYTQEEDDDFMLPIMRCVYNYVPSSRTGSTPLHNFVELALAENEIYNTLANQALEASKRKIVRSGQLIGQEDDQGNDNYLKYSDQEWTINRIDQGRTAGDYLSSLNKPQIDTQMLLLLERLQQKFQQLSNLDAPTNPSRSAKDAYLAYQSKKEASNITYLDNLRIYFAELGTYLIHIAQKTFNNSQLASINNYLEDFMSGINLAEDLKDLGKYLKLGLQVDLSTQSDAILESKRQDTMEILRVFGPDILQNVDLIDFLGLRDYISFPTDTDVYNCEKDVMGILDGTITDIKPLFDESGIYGTGVSNKLVYISVVTKKLKQVSKRFADVPKERVDLLNEYLKRHLELYAMELQKQQPPTEMPAEQAPAEASPATESVPTDMPIEVNPQTNNQII